MKMRQALVVIDMLNDFVHEGAPLEVPKSREIISNIKREIDKARQNEIPVIYLCDAHKPDDPEFKIWPPHCVEGTEGADVIEELKPDKDDFIVKKVSYSGFYNTKLEELLKSLGVQRLLLTGIVTNICVLYTGVDALMRGFEVEVIEDCVAGLNEDDHKFALRQLKEILKPRR
ncbi:MAG: cysteine hydrolase [Candidatus Omnitrophota bacterium]|nr:MAG: cysteine hydrolase [Candidatus Omnitrophota bacterium]